MKFQRTCCMSPDEKRRLMPQQVEFYGKNVVLVKTNLTNGAEF